MKTKIRVLDHPIIQEELTKLRDKRTNQVAFRKCMARIGRLAGYEIVRTMKTRKIKINTPIAGTWGIEVADRANVVIVTVLRAAIPLTEGLYKIFPGARAGIVSASRGPAPEFEIKMDYVKVPPIRQVDTLIVSDPMLATGSTLCRVLKELKRFGKPKRLILLSVIAANEGIRRVAGQFPSAEFFTCAIDKKLNSHGYIVPGLGDAGDRAFGT